MPRNADPLRALEAAFRNIRDSVQMLTVENAELRDRLDRILRSATSLTSGRVPRRGRPAGP